jgi:hypothetical protein
MKPYQLSPDPVPREAIAVAGRAATEPEVVDNPMNADALASAGPAAHLRNIAPSPSVQLSEVRAENGILRSTLQGLAVSLRQLADKIDLAEAETKARIEADMRRRF